jgi:hypothetical protein
VATVDVIILHAEPGPSAGPLERWVAAARRALADRQRAAFAAAGATEARVLAGVPDGTPFGALLRDAVAAGGRRGVVILGSGSIPLATAADRRAFVAAASRDEPAALTNNRYSSDVVAIACAGVLAGLPDLSSDNALPRWLAEFAGYPVGELPAWRLRFDVDDPLDLVLLRRARRSVPTLPPADVDTARVEAALAAVGAIARDPASELVVAGRTSSAALAWLERHAAARVRAIVEERGLRASESAASAAARTAPVRPPASILGAVLDASGAASFGDALARLGDGALVDSRVLLAHRLGADERRWPTPEDRFASDLLLHERVTDPWLRELTRSAADASIPIVLGGHTLVGPGIRLALRG